VRYTIFFTQNFGKGNAPVFDLRPELAIYYPASAGGPPILKHFNRGITFGFILDRLLM